MKCPVCDEPLREKSAGGMTLDVCYGGCGGIWFDATELERVDARGASTLHTIWQVPPGRVRAEGPRMCPRCTGEVLERKWFSELKKVEIDRCRQCGGLWLDAGEFSLIYEEIKGPKVTPSGWGHAIAEAAAAVSIRADTDPALDGSLPAP